MRNRTIRPRKCATDPRFGALTPDVQLAYWTLQCHADDAGRIPWDSAVVFGLLGFAGYGPGRVGEMLRELERAGQVAAYEVEGVAFAVFLYWEAEQRVDKAQAPKYPDPPDETSRLCVRKARRPERPRAQPVRPAAPVALAPVAPAENLGEFQLTTAPEKTKQNGAPKAGVPTDDERPQVLEVEAFYRKAMEKRASWEMSDKRMKALLARLRSGVSVRRIKAAIMGCRVSPYHMGENNTRRVYDDLELICRSPEKVDAFVETYRAHLRTEEQGAPADRWKRGEPRATAEDLIQNALDNEGGD